MTAHHGVDIIIPFKGGTNAKSRLSDCLSPDRRLALAHAMARHVLREASRVRSLRSLTLVSPCPDAAVMGMSLGARIVEDADAGGTAAACMAGLACLGSTDQVLLLSADLPMVSHTAIEGMLAWLGEVVVAPDRSGSGTNALLLRGPRLIAPQFGDDSFRRHMNASRNAGLEPQVHRDAALAFDIDDFSDLAHLAELRSASGNAEAA